MNGYDWPDKAVELLLTLYGRGVPIKEIAAALGVSEASAHGKLDKLHKEGRRPERVKPEPPPKAVAPPPPPPKPPTPPAEGLRTVVEVGPGECRFPYGDPKAEAFRFCGRRVEKPGAPYCDAHAYVVWPGRFWTDARGRVAA